MRLREDCNRFPEAITALRSQVGCVTEDFIIEGKLVRASVVPYGSANAEGTSLRRQETGERKD